MTTNVFEFIAVNFFNNMDINYTCPCGLKVHPRIRDWHAIHYEDCVYYVKTWSTLSKEYLDTIENTWKNYNNHEHIWEECLDCDKYLFIHRGYATHIQCKTCGDEYDD